MIVCFGNTFRTRRPALFFGRTISNVRCLPPLWLLGFPGPPPISSSSIGIRGRSRFRVSGFTPPAIQFLIMTCGSVRISSLGLRSGWNPACGCLVLPCAAWCFWLHYSFLSPTSDFPPLLLHGVLRSFSSLDTWFCPPAPLGSARERQDRLKTRLLTPQQCCLQICLSPRHCRW